MSFRFTRRDILAFGLTLIVSAATAGAITVAAVGGDAETTTDAIKKGAEKTGEAFEKVGEKIKEIGK